MCTKLHSFIVRRQFCQANKKDAFGNQNFSILKYLLISFNFRFSSDLGNTFELLNQNILRIMKKLAIITAFMVAVLTVNAQVSHVTVKASDLPKAITENIAKNYTGFTIKEANKVTENNVVSYNVLINKGTTSETLVYDKDGKYLRKMTQPTASTPAPASKPAEKKTPEKK